MKAEFRLEGIVPPIVLPFSSNEEIDEAAFRQEIEYHIKAGVNGIICSGATGEGHALSWEEHTQVVKIAVDQVGGRLPVFSGIIPDSTREAIYLAKAAKNAGADAVLVTSCHYYRPTEEGTYNYFKRLNAEAGLPIIVYDAVPTAIVYIDAKLMARIAELDSIVGLKQSGGDIRKLAEVILLTNGTFPVFTAVDDLLFPSFVLGAHGSMGAITTVFPELSLAMYRAVREGQLEEAKKIHERLLPVTKVLFGRPNYQSWVKAAIKLLGRDVGIARHPLHELNDADIDKLRETLAEAGAIGA